MTRMQQMTDGELATAARRHDLVANEGGDGYNPYSEEIDRRERQQPRTRTMSDVLHDLEIADSSVARESGTYDAARVEALRAEYATMQAAETAAVIAAWPLDVTVARRAEWNARRVQTIPEMRRIESEQGWTLADLKRAIAAHKL